MSAPTPAALEQHTNLPQGAKVPARRPHIHDRKAHIPIADRDNNQPAKLKAELTDAINMLIDALPTINRISKEMGQGFAASTIGDGSSGGAEYTIVENLALNESHDPAEHAKDALTEFDNMVATIKMVRGQFHRLLPLDRDQREKLLGRQNNVELCALCNLPAPDGVKRIDGQPYHASTCYKKVWRTGRAS